MKTVIPNLFEFLLWNTKDHLVKNVDNQTVSVTIDLKKKIMEVNGNRNSLVINIL